MGDLVKNEEELAAIETEIIEGIEPEEAEIVDDSFEVEIVDPAVYNNEKSEALLASEAEAEKLRQQIEDKSSSDTRDQALAASMASIQALQAQLAGGIKVDSGPEAKVAPAFDMEAHRATYNKNLYADPAKQTEAFMAPYLMELNGKIDTVNSTAAKNASKAEILLVDESRNFYTKYHDEVEKAVGDLPVSPDIYQKALSSVKSNHMDEIIAEKVAEKIAEAQLATVGPKPPATNVGNVSAPPVKGKTQITRGMQEYIQAARMKGIGDEKWLIARAKELKASGQIKG